MKKGATCYVGGSWAFLLLFVRCSFRKKMEISGLMEGSVIRLVFSEGEEWTFMVLTWKKNVELGRFLFVSFLWTWRLVYGWGGTEWEVFRGEWKVTSLVVKIFFVYREPFKIMCVCCQFFRNGIEVVRVLFGHVLRWVIDGRNKRNPLCIVVRDVTPIFLPQNT